MNVSISTQLQSILSKTSYVLQNERQERSSDDSPVSVGEEAGDLFRAPPRKNGIQI